MRVFDSYNLNFKNPAIIQEHTDSNLLVHYEKLIELNWKMSDVQIIVPRSEDPIFQLPILPAHIGSRKVVFLKTIHKCTRKQRTCSDNRVWRFFILKGSTFRCICFLVCTVIGFFHVSMCINSMYLSNMPCYVCCL